MMSKTLLSVSLLSALMVGLAMVDTAVPLEKATLQGNETISTPAGEVELINSHISATPSASAPRT